MKIMRSFGWDLLAFRRWIPRGILVWWSGEHLDSVRLKLESGISVVAR